MRSTFATILRLAKRGHPSKMITSQNCFPFALCIFITTTPVSGFALVEKCARAESALGDRQSVGVGAVVPPLLRKLLS